VRRNWSQNDSKRASNRVVQGFPYLSRNKCYVKMKQNKNFPGVLHLVRGKSDEFSKVSEKKVELKERLFGLKDNQRRVN